MRFSWTEAATAISHSTLKNVKDIIPLKFILDFFMSKVTILSFQIVKAQKNILQLLDGRPATNDV